MERKLYRSRRDRMLGGVCGGIGEYLRIDPVLVRLFVIVLALAVGWGVLLYLILWVVVPEAPASELVGEGDYARLDVRQRNLLLGGALVAAGVLFLTREVTPWLWAGLHRLWPLVLVAAGVLLLVGYARSER